MKNKLDYLGPMNSNFNGWEEESIYIKKMLNNCRGSKNIQKLQNPSKKPYNAFPCPEVIMYYADHREI